MSDERQILNAVLRKDLAAFIQRSFRHLNPRKNLVMNWHIFVLAWYLERFARGEIPRLIVCLPPRNLKSHCISVSLPAWMLGHEPALRIVAASYAGDLAFDFSRQTRRIMKSAWYRQAFPKARLGPKITEELFETTRGGYRLSTSVGGSLTGRGGDRTIIDDPIKADDALSDAKRDDVNRWFFNTLVSRPDDKRNEGILITMQRLHPDDLVGRILDASGEHWEVLSLPAIAEHAERFVLPDGRAFGRQTGEPLNAVLEPLDVLARLRRDMGPYAFSAQYLQQPIPLDGEIVKWSWFRSFTLPIGRQKDDDIIISWDTANKGEQVHDHSVGTTWLQRGDDHYLIDVFRQRLTYPELKKAVVELAQRHQADTVLIEDAGTGQALIQELRAGGPVRPIPITPEGDKVTRLARVTSKIEAGFVHLPADASWLQEFQRELLAFPRSAHKDQVDSFSQYLNWEGLGRRREQAIMSEHLARCLELMEEGSTERAFNDPDAPWNLFGSASEY